TLPEKLAMSGVISTVIVSVCVSFGVMICPSGRSEVSPGSTEQLSGVLVEEHAGGIDAGANGHEVVEPRVDAAEPLAVEAMEPAPVRPPTTARSPIRC